MTSLIQSLEVSYLVHSTEDQERIGSAVERMLGIKVAATTEELEGYFGNPIVRASYHLTGEAASSAFAKLARELPSTAKDELLQNLGKMMDEHSALYLRLDKQAIVVGKLLLGGREPVRLRVKPRLFLLKEGGAEFFSKALEGGS